MKKLALVVRTLIPVALFVAFTPPAHAQLGYWKTLPKPHLAQFIYELDMANDRYGMVVGPPGPFDYTGISITYDGGNHWLDIIADTNNWLPQLPSYFHFRGICVIDEQNAWVVGDSAMVYFTTDGGFKWKGYDSLWPGPPVTLRDVEAADHMDVVIVGGDSWRTNPPGGGAPFLVPPTILHTRDGGMVWWDESPTGIPPGLFPALHKVEQNQQQYYVVGEEGTILKFQQNGGWTLMPPPTGGAQNHFYNMSVISPQTLAISGSGPGGVGAAYKNYPWNSRFTPVTPTNTALYSTNLRGIEFLTEEIGWAAGDQSFISGTTDGGANWKDFQVIGGGAPGIVTDFEFLDSLNGLAVGGDPTAPTAWVLRYYGRPPKPDMSNSDTEADFGEVRCEESVETFFIIRNKGDGDLTIQSGGIQVGNPDVQLLNVTYPIRIPPKKSLKIEARWTPQQSQTGPFSTSVFIYTNDENFNPWVVTLEGFRYQAILEIQPEAMVYQDLCLGDDLLFPVYAQNSGNDIPTFIAIEFVSGDNEFVLESPDPDTKIDKQVPFQFRFTPTKRGERKGMYRIIGGYPACPDTSFIELTGKGLVTEVEAIASTLNFGEVCVGKTADLELQLINTGNTQTYLNIPKLINGSAQFPSQYLGSVFLDIGDTVRYKVQFAPQTTGDIEGTYQFAFGPCSDTLEYTLKGKGIDTQVEYIPKAALVLGPTIVGREVIRTVRVRNTGKTVARLTEVSFSKSHPDITFFTTPNLPQLLQPNMEISFEIKFDPTTLGTFETELVTRWSNVCADSAFLTVVGECVPNPHIVPPLSFDLGLQECPEPKRDSVYIKNIGNGPLVFSSAEILGDDPDHFTLISPLPDDTIRANDSTALVIEYNNPNETPSSAFLLYVHNDAERLPTRIDLTGERKVSEFDIEGDSATLFFSRLFVREERPYTIRNTSNNPVEVYQVEVTKEMSVYDVTPDQALPVTLQPGQTLGFMVGFTPNGTGPFLGHVTVRATPCDYTHVLSLNGEGDTDGLSIDRGSIAFNVSPCEFEALCDTVRLRNQGSEAINVTGLNVDQSVPVFSITARNTPFQLRPGETENVILCADPAIFGPNAATLRIESDDPSYPLLNVQLTSDRDSVAIVFSAMEIDFGMLAQCDAEPTQQLVIENHGETNETLTITAAAGESSFDYQLATGFVLKPGRQATFDITFLRKAFGAFTDTIFVQGSTCPQVYPIVLRGEWNEQVYTVNPSALTFPNVNIGSNTSRSFTVTNTGGFEASIASIAVTPPANYSILAGTPSTIDAGGFVTVQVQFQPSIEGTIPATACVIFDDPCRDTICVDLTGEGVRGDLITVPAVLQFGNLAQCEELILEDTLRNQGTGEISLLSATVIGPGSAAYTLLNPITAPEVLASGEERIFRVRATTSTIATDGPVFASLSVNTDDTKQPVVDLPLESVKETFIVSADGTLNFGSIEPGVPSVLNFTLENTGSAPYCFTSADFPPDVTIVPNLPICLGAGESIDLQVTITPSTEGPYNDVLTLQTNDPCTDSTLIAINAVIQEGLLLQTPDVVNLPSTVYCQESQFDIEIENDHIYDAVIDSIKLEGTDRGYFVFASAPSLPQALPIGATESYSFLFAGENASREYYAEIHSYITINGTQQELVTVIHTETTELTLSISDVFFPPVVLGGQSQVMLATIVNPSDTPLLVSSIVTTDSEYEIVSIDPPIGSPLQPGESIVVEVRFVPADTGIRVGEIQAFVDSPCTLAVNGLLRGEGVQRTVVTTNLSIGDLEGATDDIIRIPVRVDDDLDGTEVDAWSGSISFNRTMLYPLGIVTEGTLSEEMTVNWSYDSDEGMVSMSASGGYVMPGLMPVVYVECLVLLGTEETTDIVISDDFSFNTGFANVDSRLAGTFRLTNFCAPEDRLLQAGPGFTLAQNSPNPVSRSADDQVSISYTLPHDGAVQLVLHDAMGKELRTLIDEQQATGSHLVKMPIGELEAGVYFYTVRFDGEEKTRKMLITR
ncbi:MAG: hypothetical protein CL946_12875 [Ectothiorhodospiraceae bacterium]|nr:hypothetical protein [Ectothiorhodospiraceae bacterium]